MNLLTGMHRSGSSLAARLLRQTGADLGDAAGFYPADRWNPDGYFEQVEILDLNRHLLHGPWGRLSYFWLPGPDTIRRRGRRLAARLRDTGARYRGRLVKDNRFSLTAPAWVESGVAIEKIVVCLREPEEVAASLQRRNWITRGLALHLWTEHYRRLLPSLEGRPHWWLHYSRLIDPERGFEEFMAVARFLGLDVGPGRDAGWFLEVVRTRPEAKASRPRDYPAAVRKLWEELGARHDRQSDIGRGPSTIT